MRRVVVKAHVERTRPASTDELNGAIREQIREVSVHFNRPLPIEKIHDTCGVAVSEVTLTCSDDSEEFTEAMLQRIELRIVAKVIFPNQDGFVIVGLEQR